MSYEVNLDQAQANTNIKILKELEEQKRRIRQSTTSSILTTTASATATQSNIPDNQQHQTVIKTPTNISILNTNTFGQFISTDSPFGNTIIPILPRFKE